MIRDYENDPTGSSYMNDDIKVTVIIPVYNTEAYIGNCLKSVVEQTLSEIEIICIDDQSTDNSHSIIEEYCQIDRRISCMLNEKNSGLSFTRNVGIKAAKGKYVFFLDSDDEIVTDALEKLYNIAITKNYQMVFFDFINFYETEKLENDLPYCDKDRTFFEGESTGIELFTKGVEYGDMQAQACFKLYDRSFLIEKGLFFHEGILHEDIPYAVKTMFLADRVYFTGEKLYKWRHREKSITAAKTTSAHIEGRIKGIFEIIEFMDDIKLNQRERVVVEKYLNQLIMNTKEKLKELENPDLLFEHEMKYRSFLQFFVVNKREISSSQKERIIKNQQIYIYGAGKTAQGFMEDIKSWDVKICGVIVTKRQGQTYFYGYETEEVDKVDENMKKTMVIIAASKVFHKEIYNNLKQAGFDNIECLEYVG